MHDAFRNIVTWPYGILQRVSLAWPYYFSKQTSDSANVGGCTFRSCLPKASSHVHPSLPQCLQSVLPWGSGRVHLMGLIIIYVEWFKSLLKPPISIHWCEIHPGVFLMRGFRCAASLPRLDGGDGDPFPGKLFELGILHICLYLYAVTGKNWYKYKWFLVHHHVIFLLSLLLLLLLLSFVTPTSGHFGGAQRLSPSSSSSWDMLRSCLKTFLFRPRAL